MEIFNQEQNRLKYEKDGKDLIDEWSEISYKIAVVACITKVQGYFRRYNSNAEKAKNESDIKKSLDYLSRAKQVMPQANSSYAYLLQLEYAINNNKINSIENLCYQILATII